MWSRQWYRGRGIHLGSGLGFVASLPSVGQDFEELPLNPSNAAEGMFTVETQGEAVELHIYLWFS